MLYIMSTIVSDLLCFCVVVYITRFSSLIEVIRFFYRIDKLHVKWCGV